MAAPMSAAHGYTLCDMCKHPRCLHHPIDGCLILRCGCWRTRTT